MVVASDGALVSATDGATAWLHLLPGNGSGTADALRSVAHQAIAHPMRPAEVRARAGNGAWVQLRAARFVGEDRVAVIVEPAHPGRIFELMMSAHGLTAREREVVRLVLEGQSTSQMSSTLSVTPHTVQQHLKSVFDRMGVRSRRELVAQAFFAHYAPRFRDNETPNDHQDSMRENLRQCRLRTGRTQRFRLNPSRVASAVTTVVLGSG